MATKYTDWAFLVSRYPDAGRMGGAEALTPAWIEPAEAEVEARLASRYVFPLTTTPAPLLIKDLATDLAYLRMNSRQKWAKDFEASLNARFEALVNGTMGIPGIEETGSNVAYTTGNGIGSSFGMDDPLDWRVSSDWTQPFPADRDCP